jgi:hypothetical protein
MKYNRLTRRMKILSDAEQEDNLNKFKSENTTLWNMLEEVESRIPWQRIIVQDLIGWVKRSGNLTEKQRGLVTSLYMDNCVTTDVKIEEQREARKLCYRLLEVELGQVRNFVYDVTYKTDTRSFTAGQLRAIKNIAKRFRHKLEDIELDEEAFDGWIRKVPGIRLDKLHGL